MNHCIKVEPLTLLKTFGFVVILMDSDVRLRECVRIKMVNAIPQKCTIIIFNLFQPTNHMTIRADRTDGFHLPSQRNYCLICRLLKPLAQLLRTQLDDRSIKLLFLFTF